MRISRFTGALCFWVVVVNASSQPGLSPRQAPQIPSYVVDYAPIVYLDVNEYYFPADINAQVTHTIPTVNFTRIDTAPANLSISNLSSVNAAGNCTFLRFGSCPIYLTSRRMTSYPPFFNGTMPNPDTGETEGARSSAIIVNDHGNGVVDAFYMYFYAFNYGYVVFGTLVGNHVGDWEHTMVRFLNGVPQNIWYSQHDGGEVFTYDAVRKRGRRPIVFSARGTHANYAVPGRHSRQVSVVTINDFTSRGARWDPVKSAYFYTFTPTQVGSTKNPGTFAAADPPISSLAPDSNPTDWLLFFGRWGNKQLPDSNPHQNDLAGVAYTWEDGPTGPYDKDLNRANTCPDGQDPCVTKTVLPSVSGNPRPSQTVSRPSTSATGTGTGAGAAPTGNSAPKNTLAKAGGGVGGNSGTVNLPTLGGAVWVTCLGWLLSGALM